MILYKQMSKDGLCQLLSSRASWINLARGQVRYVVTDGCGQQIGALLPYTDRRRLDIPLTEGIPPQTITQFREKRKSFPPSINKPLTFYNRNYLLVVGRDSLGLLDLPLFD